ncbi:hypothetical protein LSH36_424g01044 [Paralvinella palmiformis]|uniref:FAD dependent oxidoreductase domain-containing protein n=1 Tax=Paralvinella palmiformis TaxID=53620 RepID=A0AAD9N039_9ANNE|nr:hypothetical protein LSH36_424g01044 [Paralvinella palmiformis]
MGLSTALRILDTLDDVSVSIVTEQTTPLTMSDGAGGFWQPYVLGDTPTEKMWGGETFQYLLDLSSTESAAIAGIYLTSGEDVYHDIVPDPFWSDIVLGFRHLTRTELQRYSGARINEKGGKLINKRINNFSELYPHYDVIVNCSGLGSQMLCQDIDLQPCKGQLIKVDAPWIKRFLNADDDQVYILVNCDAVILGGTNEVGEYSTHVNKKERQRIWTKCCELLPSLKHSKYISDWVGFRPSRSKVRLQRETSRFGDSQIEIIHNYGHGGAGITLHWGCAGEATKLVREALGRQMTAKL